jgi:hypothetical protein
MLNPLRLSISRQHLYTDNRDQEKRNHAKEPPYKVVLPLCCVILKPRPLTELSQAVIEEVEKYIHHIGISVPDQNLMWEVFPTKNV